MINGHCVSHALLRRKPVSIVPPPPRPPPPPVGMRVTGASNGGGMWRLQYQGFCVAVDCLGGMWKV